MILFGQRIEMVGWVSSDGVVVRVVAQNCCCWALLTVMKDEANE